MDYILTSNSPSLDLHGEHIDMVNVLVSSFILDSFNQKKNVVRIIHGKSTNILTKEVHKVLRTLPNVERFYINNWNTGETIVCIKIV